jgi:hypothetical protein
MTLVAQMAILDDADVKVFRHMMSLQCTYAS